MKNDQKTSDFVGGEVQLEEHVTKNPIQSLGKV